MCARVCLCSMFYIVEMLYLRKETEAFLLYLIIPAKGNNSRKYRYQVNMLQSISNVDNEVLHSANLAILFFAI